MPAALDMAGVRREIRVELLGERQCHMRAAVDIAVDSIALAHDEAVEAPGAQFEHEVAGGILGDEGERAQRDASGCGGEAIHSDPPRNGEGDHGHAAAIHAARARRFCP